MPADIHEQFPELFQFLAGCFHEDWEGVPDDVIRAFVAAAPTERRQSIANEIDRLLAETTDGKELSRSLTALGCRYAPEADGLSDRQWLSSVRAAM